MLFINSHRRLDRPMIKFISNQTSDFSVILPKNHSQAQNFAADQLIAFVFQASQIKLPKLIADDNLPASCILLGDHPFIKTEYPEIDFELLGEEGYWWKFQDNHIIIAGSKARGTIYGVVSFLEEFLKIGFYDLEYTLVPSCENLELAPLSQCKLPSFEYRMVTYLEKLDPEGQAFEPEYHEAVQRVEDSEQPPRTVVRVLVKG